MNGKKWFISILIMTISALTILAGCVFWTDPFFHYRKPRDYFFYKLYDQRSQNDGITRHFDYDAIITGTSMAENFLPSQFDNLMGTNSIKVTYAGATYKEINDNLNVAYESGHEIKYVLRPVDYTLLIKDKDEMRLDMGEYPVYLTNKNPFDDIKYLINKDVIGRYMLPLFVEYFKGTPGGHTSFDEYSYNANLHTFSKDDALVGRTVFEAPTQINSLTDEETTMISENVRANVVDIAAAHPETTFICFFPPYSMAYFGGIWESGDLNKILTAKQMATDLMLEYDNIHVYDFATAMDITQDLNRYRDEAHYDQYVNEWIIERVADGENSGESSFRLMKDNAESVIEDEREQFNNYDYNSLID
jgi:hypothetical protein